MSEELHHMSATQAVRLIREKVITSEELTRACLARIEERECDIGAWEYLDPAYALDQARLRDRSPEQGGFLHGLPIGIKDVCDTDDMPTCYGSRARAGNRPPIDASCVATLRSAGAVVLGKTVTTEFAGRFAGRTANPHDVRRTPGGSSSGSAAAVADFMVPLALGTQTGGSVIRPAAYCGIVGYKPTFGHFSFQGVHHGAETFDTLGCMARTIADIELLRNTLLGFKTPQVTPSKNRPFQIGFCRTRHWQQADEATRSLLASATQQLAAAEAMVTELELPEDFEKLDAIVPTIFSVEYARSIAPVLAKSPENLSGSLMTMIDIAHKTTPEAYFKALADLDDLKYQVGSILDRYDFVLTPSTVGEASMGHKDTGPITFNVIWQALGLPCVTLPLFTGPAGMSIGAQLVGRRHHDLELLGAAKWVWSVLGDAQSRGESA